jgi:hypothetical protein
MGLIAKDVRSDLARLRAGLSLLVLVASGSAWGGASFDAGTLRGDLESKGFTPTQTQAALAMLDRAEARGLPASALANRIREGMARRAEPSAILGVLTDRLSDLERADDMTRRCAKEGIAVRDRDRSLMRLADSFSMGVTPGDVVTVLPAASRAGRDLESVSRAAEVMGRLGQKGFPPADTRDVLAAATGAGWTRDKMDGLVDVFLAAQRLGVAREKMHRILAEGIRDKKDPASLIEDMKRNTKSDSSSHSSAQSHSPTSPSSGSSTSGSGKGGKGGGTSHGPGPGAKSMPPHPTGPPPRPPR